MPYSKHPHIPHNLIKVLVCDDHIPVQRYILEALAAAGIKKVKFAGDGHDAIELVQKAHYDGEQFHIVFLDWSMPHLDGLEVLKYIKAHDDYKHIAVVMVTAKATHREVIEAIRTGTTSYIIKPTTKEEIIKKMKHAVLWIDRHGHLQKHYAALSQKHKRG